MSHLKERAEKTCLNCNAELTGRFCQVCGQENIEPKETAWHLLTHFFNDITHFDGKFFDTLGHLIRKPGFLPKQYMLGKRASYLNPIRMYIFTSAIFFLIVFSASHLTDPDFKMSMKMDIGGKTLEELQALSPDSLKIFTAKANNGIAIPREALAGYLDSLSNNLRVDITGEKYKSKEAYDTLLKNGAIKHGWLHRKLMYKEFEINEKYRNNVTGYLNNFFSTFFHHFPQILFISLPLFALFLQLLYRRQKDYYYVSHGIFSIHFYIFVFIAMVFSICVSKLAGWLHWGWLRYIQTLLTLWIFFYLYKAMRNFYKQGRGKTIVKFLLLNIFSFLMMLFLFVVFILFSFMKI